MLTLERIFFLIKFSEDSYYDKVVRGGLWFIKEHFLAIKPWEPYFKASKATFSLVAVWMKFPELPIEFYDSSVLQEISSTIGLVLRIDSYTASGSRASYACLCVQIDLSKLQWTHHIKKGIWTPWHRLTLNWLFNLKLVPLLEPLKPLKPLMQLSHHINLERFTCKLSMEKTEGKISLSVKIS